MVGRGGVFPVEVGAEVMGGLVGEGEKEGVGKGGENFGFGRNGQGWGGDEDGAVGWFERGEVGGKGGMFEHLWAVGGFTAEVKGVVGGGFVNGGLFGWIFEVVEKGNGVRWGLCVGDEEDAFAFAREEVGEGGGVIGAIAEDEGGDGVVCA